MRIDFHPSAGPSLGIEWELMLARHSDGDLANEATGILASLEGRTEKAKHELFENTVEIITGVCQTVSEARGDLLGTLSLLNSEAVARDLDVLCAGTHPFSDWRTQKVSPDPRYHQLIEEMQWAARRLLIFGVHVHVGVRSPERVIAIANAVTAYIPHFLALSASSPYWKAVDTGLASARSKVFEALPTAGLPYHLSGWDDFEQFMEALISARAIQTIREVWWDVRPHPDFGTVELRMFDGMSTLSEVAAAGALAQSLVHWLDSLLDRGYALPAQPLWLIRENKWRAARHGLDAEVIVNEQGECVVAREAIIDLVEELTPAAKRLDCLDELSYVKKIIEIGAGYERQRRVVAQGGTTADVVTELISELRSDTGITRSVPAAPQAPTPSPTHT